jgi:replicative DNA helicase
MVSTLSDSPTSQPARGPDDDVSRLRIPPHSVEAEQSVLGGLLLDNSAWDRAGDLLTDSDFYRYEHRFIFSAIGALVNASKPADVITVFEQLQSLGKGAECGGLAYLNSLAQSVISAANIRRYAEIVRERAVLRKLVVTSDEIATTAFNPQGQAVSQIPHWRRRFALAPGFPVDGLAGGATHRPRQRTARERRRRGDRRAHRFLRP